MSRAWALTALALLLGTNEAAGQIQPPSRPIRVDTARVPAPRPIARDTAPRVGLPSDTIPPDTATWLPPDSIMAALLARPDYVVTRYEGSVVTFDAANTAFSIQADSTRRAQVERDGQLVHTDSVIVYRDDVDSVLVAGDFRIVPGEGQPPIAGSGTAAYSLTDREGVLTNASVIVEEGGDRWFINAHVGKPALGDSAAGIPTRFYGLGGTLTSCEEEEPHYHFRLKEVKRTDRTLVARPSVFYIQDIPVLWLPFVFQDIRPGRRSGMLPPRFGASDIVRNNPGYRRHIENVGYYWAISDYMDATAWLDWRSSAGGDSLDPGWYRLNGEWKYNWMSRFLDGRLGAAYMQENDGDNNLAVSWGHRQRFGQNRNFTANVNYVTSTQIQRQNTFNPAQAMATIRSSFTLTDKLGPAALSLGGTRTQYPGREQIEQSFPSLSITTPAIDVAPWLTWTPRFSYSEAATLHIDQAGQFTTRIRELPGGGTTVDTLDRNRHVRTISIGTPIRIFGFDLNNDVRIADDFRDYPEQKTFYLGGDSAQKVQRIFAESFKTEVDWNPSFSLPALASNRFRITPSVSLQNVAGGPFWVRSDLSGGRWVSQSKRLVYGVTASPTVYGLWPGVGPFSRFRHSLSPTINFSYAGKADVDPEYLAAQGQYVQGYLGGLAQKSVSFGLSQLIEAKVRRASDTGATDGEKLKLLSMTFTPLAYDFERARKVGRSLAGLVTENLGFRATSDLLPGFDLSLDYSLFQGSTLSDTARFDPFLTRITSQFRIGSDDNPLAVINRLFGRAVPQQGPAPLVPGDQPPETEALQREMAARPVAGQAARGAQFIVPTTTQGWEATLSFSRSATRPPVGGTVINVDPKQVCEVYRLVDPLAYDRCLATPTNEEMIPPTTIGGPVLLPPPQTSLTGNLAFALTPKWSATWNTSYDFEEREFAQHAVTLQRDMHDFRAIFAFTRSPNGNFAFNFFIALKPQPDLKFDYSRTTIGQR